MSYKIAQLNLPSKTSKARTLSDIFIAQPDSIKESLAGKLFMLIEINKADNSGLKLINFLFQQLNNNYYQNDKIILRERISTLKPEHIFETALAKTNKDLEKFIKQEKIKIPFSNISVTAGLLYEQNLHFASTGKNRILLWVKNEKEYKLSDLGKVAKDPSSKQTKQKQFNDVISGQLPPRSFILISNEALPEYISEKKLTDIISTLPPKSATEQIKNLLQNVNSYVSFQSIIVKITKASEIQETRVYSTVPDNISQLSATESATEKIMSPSGIFSFRKWLKPGSKQTSKQRHNKTLGLKDKIYSEQKPIFNIKKTSNTIKHFLLALLNGFYYIFKTIFSMASLRSKISKLKPKLGIYGGKISAFLFSLDLKRRLLLLTVIISIIVVGANITLNKKEQEEIVQKEEYQELVAEIEKKQHQAEASLLYSNEASAQKLFVEITELMKQLPQVTEKQQNAYDDFSNKLKLQLEKTNRVIRFDEKTIVADFKKINENAKPNNIFLLPIAGRLYSTDSEDNSIYIVDLKDLSTTVAADTDEATTKLAYPVMASDESVYYFGTGEILEVKTTDSAIQKLPINLLGDAETFIAADTYNGRYYLLNRQENQIYRYTRNGNSFSSPYAWIQEAADLEKAIDVSIDGYVYVLLDNGKIIKYLRGKSVEFKLEFISPELSAPSAIYSSLDLKYLYILDPSESRLIMYDKSGQFLEQYKDDFLKDAKGFAIDETNKQMYFLKGTEILKTPALHLIEDE